MTPEQQQLLADLRAKAAELSASFEKAKVGASPVVQDNLCAKKNAVDAALSALSILDWL